MAKKHLNVNKGFLFKYELLFSTSYLELTKSARDLLHCLTMELKFSRKGNRISYPNNGSVSYTAIQFKEEFGRASNTYLTVRNQLIKNGLIRQTYRGIEKKFALKKESFIYSQMLFSHLTTLIHLTV